MEKVKLTKQQAEILETELKSSYVDGDKSKLVKMYLNLEHNEWEEGYPLTCLSNDEFIRALYHPEGYETELTEQEQINELWKDNEISSVVVRHYLNGITDTLTALNRQDLIPKDGAK